MSFVRNRWFRWAITIICTLYGAIEFYMRVFPSPYSAESLAEPHLTKKYQNAQLQDYEFVFCMVSSTHKEVVDCQLRLNGVARVEKYSAAFTEDGLAIIPFNNSARKRGWEFTVVVK
ncbi:TPA: hypothetical protein RQJ64_004299 [Vibrio vulnificus]|nr:hypothetical protein [Vibrio vulnificus]HDY7507317.1 hypothetical protein [Vibrio vulnificus]